FADPARAQAASTARRHLGSGLYLCGVCGEALSSFSKGNGGPMKYKCRKNDCVLRDLVLLDKWVLTHLIKRLSRPDVAELLAVWEEPVDVRGAQAELRQARATLDDLAAAFGAGEMDMQEWRIARAAARVRKEKAEAALATAVQVNPVAGLVGVEDVAGDVREGRTARGAGRVRKEKAEAVLAAAVEVSRVAGLGGVEDVEGEWRRLDLSRQRSVVDWMMTVRVLPARVGRRRGGGYWDPEG